MKSGVLVPKIYVGLKAISAGKKSRFFPNQFGFVEILRIVSIPVSIQEKKMTYISFLAEKKTLKEHRNDNVM